MMTSYDTYISLTHTATDEIDDEGNIVRYMPDLSPEYYEYMHTWFIHLIAHNPRYKEVLGGVLEAFFISFAPIEGELPRYGEECIEDQIANIINKLP